MDSRDDQSLDTKASTAAGEGPQVSQELKTPSVPQGPVTYGLLFHGRASEYFRIWIVNLLLTVLTLGIYSAWAKVRTRRYFSGNTELAGARFDYTGDPMGILKGRLLVAGLILLHYLMGTVSETLPLISGSIFILAIPWIVVTSLAFNMRNTIYRGLRFGFHRDHKQAYFIYVTGIVLAICTLGLSIPYTLGKGCQFIANKLRFGAAQFRASLQVKEVYWIFGKTLSVLILIFLVLGGTAYTLYTVWADVFTDAARNLSAPLVTALILGWLAVFYLTNVGAGVAIGIQVKRLFFNRLHLSDIHLNCTVSTWHMLWIHFSNAILILISLGLLYPWCRIRAYRYYLSRMTLHSPDGDIDRFRQGMNEEMGAFGDASADLFDIGFGT